MLPDNIDVSEDGLTINPKSSTVMPPEKQPGQPQPGPNAMQIAAKRQAKADMKKW